MSSRVIIRDDMIVSATDDLAVFDDDCAERSSAFLCDILRRKRNGFMHEILLHSEMKR
jgi:hypothetical protein